jgi:hypothetical protein
MNLRVPHPFCAFCRKGGLLRSIGNKSPFLGLEERALAVLYDVVDEKVLREYSETNVLGTFSICSDWIKHKQQDNPGAWVQLERLYHR